MIRNGTCGKLDHTTALFFRKSRKNHIFVIILLLKAHANKELSFRKQTYLIRSHLSKHSKRQANYKMGFPQRCSERAELHRLNLYRVIKLEHFVPVYPD